MASGSQLLGRETEQQHVRTLLGQARNGRGGALYVTGEPGSWGSPHGASWPTGSVEPPERRRHHHQDYAPHVVRDRCSSAQARVTTRSRRHTMPFVTPTTAPRSSTRTGAPTAPRSLLSHGWPLNADAWEAAALFLAEHGHRAIAHDRRGHGRSSQTWHGNEMDTYADDLACLIDTLDLSDLTLVGHSTGGGEIVHYLGRHGTDRVAKLVLVSAVPPLMLRTDDNPEGLPDRGLRRDPRRRGRRPVAALPRSGRRAVLRPQPQPATSPRASGTRSGCRAWPAGTAAPTSASPRSPPPTSAPTWPRSTSHPGHPRRRRPDRPVRGRRQALRRSWSTARS